MRQISILVICLFLFACSDEPSNDCDLDCQTLKYNLIVVDVDLDQAIPVASNIQVVAKSTFQDMTHPRVSPDKNWVAFTKYNVTNSEGCASVDSGYIDTEIKAVPLDGSQNETSIIPVSSGNLNSNNYWYGSGLEFTYLSGPPGSTKVMRAQVDSSMQLVSAPIEISIPATITPFDPQAISDSLLVYAGQYNSGGLVKSLFIQSINPSSVPVGLTLGRDSADNTLYNGDIFENDPKLAPDGSKVAFMRRAPNAGANGFGWRIYIVNVADPLNEVDISNLGNSQITNDVLPEWVDNNRLIFANIDSTTSFNQRTLWTMQSDGSERKQIILPEGFRYSDVYPYEVGGITRLVISAEKINTNCDM